MRQARVLSMNCILSLSHFECTRHCGSPALRARRRSIIFCFTVISTPFRHAHLPLPPASPPLLHVYVVSHASPPPPTLPPHPHPVSSFCYQPCFHNNCDLAVMRNHFYSEAEKTDKMRGRACGRLSRRCIRWKKTNNKATKKIGDEAK